MKRSSATLTWKAIDSVRRQERIRNLKKEGNWPPKTPQSNSQPLNQADPKVKTNKSE
jgi:hypothetical protein